LFLSGEDKIGTSAIYMTSVRVSVVQGVLNSRLLQGRHVAIFLEDRPCIDRH